MGFDYFYNREAERFLFYRIPHVFFEEPKFKALSSDAKILYALFFHRITLSLKKGWIDEYGRVYIIFTLEEIQEKFGCSNKTAVKIMAELDGNTGGIGLIEKKRQGLGKPNIIYVKDFMSDVDSECKNYTSEVKNLHTRDVETTHQEVNNLHGTNNNLRNTDKSKSDLRGKKTFGIFQNVFLSDKELESLRKEIPYQLENYIERLSAYIKSTGKGYENHAATILSWYLKDKGNEKKSVIPTIEEYDKGEHL